MHACEQDGVERCSRKRVLFLTIPAGLQSKLLHSIPSRVRRKCTAYALLMRRWPLLASGYDSSQLDLLSIFSPIP